MNTEKYSQLSDTLAEKIAQIICSYSAEEESLKESSYMALKKEIPIYKKDNLTLEEASVYFNIGQNKLREMSNDRNCTFVLWIGSKRMIKRRKLEEYLDKAYSI
jgi:excisionase family DNA binding protein